MIRFECQNCGKAVCVHDTHAGENGRCPQCQAVITIPTTNRGDNVAALAAALKGDSAKPYRPPPPPPSRVDAAETDEFELVNLQTSSASETDTYPAIRDEPSHAGNDPDEASDPATHEPLLPATKSTSRSRMFFCLIAVLVVTALAAGATLLICRYLI